MRYIYTCLECKKEIEEVQGDSSKVKHIRGAMCRACCREAVSFNMDCYSKIEREAIEMGEGKGHVKKPCKWCGKKQAARWLKHHEARCDKKPRSKVSVPELIMREPSLTELVQNLFEQAENMQETARRMAGILGLEL